MIEAKSLVKTFKVGDTTIRALDGVTLTIADGDLFAVTGASGSGKSTLMHILGCLERPDSGDYILAGENVAKLGKNRLAEIRNRRIGFVFQTFNLLPRMSALENVALPLLYAGDRNPRGKAENALEIVGLKDRMSHEPSQLSGGQRQRVSIARAIVTNPAIVLADEPTGNLDSKTGREIMTLFQSLNSQGRTVVVVTHSREIAGLCPKRVTLVDGRVVDFVEKGGGN